MHVGVVGAGIAGLAAASRLTEAGARVTVVDKGRGPGGRTSSRRAAPYAFDHGAPYFEAHDAGLVARLEAWQAQGHVAHWGARIAVLEADGAVRSVAPRGVWVGVPAMSAVAKALAAPLDVRSGLRVEALESTGDGWSLRCDDGEGVGPFDALVLTPPPAQTADLASSGGLDALAAEAADVTAAPCLVAMLGFDAPVRVSFDAAHVDRVELAWIGRETSKPGRGTTEAWTLQATPSWSAQHLEREPDEIATALAYAWRELAALSAPAPAHVAAHRWRYAGTPFPLDAPLSDADARVVACGDWTHPHAGVEGAWLAGCAAAERLLGHQGDTTA